MRARTVGGGHAVEAHYVPEQHLTHLNTHFIDAFSPTLPLLAFHSRYKPIIALKHYAAKL